MVIHNTRFYRASLALLAVIVLVMAACTQTAPTVHKHTLSSDPVVRWIQQHAVPLRTTDQGGSDADLTSLQHMVGQASIVGLGEETHGTHEIIDMKARLAEFLISHLGYTTFVMENDWGSSQLLDAYINGGSGNLADVMARSLFGSWQTHEYQTLFAWMRAYNADPAHSTKIHFVGMDLQDVSQSDFDDVEHYVQMVAPSQATSVASLYAPIVASSLPNAYIHYISLDTPTKQQYQNQAQQVYDLLQVHQQEYVSHSSPQSFAFALQNARIIVQFTTFRESDTQDTLGTSGARYYQRDTFMAENVAWFHDHEAGSNPKMIVWAHDGHIANDTSYGSQDHRNMGGELRALYKENYLPIGTSLYQGAMRVYHYPKGVIQTIDPPDTDTYNYTLGQVGLPLYMLDLRTIPSGPVINWAGKTYTSFALYGLGGEDLTTVCALNQWFDVIIHIQNTTPANHL